MVADEALTPGDEPRQVQRITGWFIVNLFERTESFEQLVFVQVPDEADLVGILINEFVPGKIVILIALGPIHHDRFAWNNDGIFDGEPRRFGHWQVPGIHVELQDGIE